jgi:hypothetical protein
MGASATAWAGTWQILPKALIVNDLWKTMTDEEYSRALLEAVLARLSRGGNGEEQW